MKTLDAIIERLNELCKQHNITPHALSYKAAVPQATIKSILNHESQNPGIVTLKKICDGFDDPKVSLAHFFDTETFRSLEQEIE